MSENPQRLRKKMDSAEQLGHVVRTMKVLSAANVTQFEKAAQASAGYYQNVELGLAASVRDEVGIHAEVKGGESQGLIVFGSDQGLVGQFNETLANEVDRQVVAKGSRPKIWAVGERMRSTLLGLGLSSEESLPVPTSIPAIAQLVGKILLEVDAARTRGEIGPVIVFHNRPLQAASYEISSRRILPFDSNWRQDLKSLHWPTKILPEVIDPEGQTLSALVLEYLFLALFRACAESLASENISRLMAMQAAEQNIRDSLEVLTRRYHRTRQSVIDEELFDVISSFEALSKPDPAAV